MRQDFWVHNLHIWLCDQWKARPAARQCPHLTSILGTTRDHWVQQTWCPYWGQLHRHLLRIRRWTHRMLRLWCIIWWCSGGIFNDGSLLSINPYKVWSRLGCSYRANTWHIGRCRWDSKHIHILLSSSALFSFLFLLVFYHWYAVTGT